MWPLEEGLLQRMTSLKMEHHIPQWTFFPFFLYFYDVSEMGPDFVIGKTEHLCLSV